MIPRLKQGDTEMNELMCSTVFICECSNFYLTGDNNVKKFNSKGSL
jgi:hypothetical protein